MFSKTDFSSVLTGQTWVGNNYIAAMLKHTTVRETGVSRHHGSPNKGPPEIYRSSGQFGALMFKEGHFGYTHRTRIKCDFATIFIFVLEAPKPDVVSLTLVKYTVEKKNCMGIDIKNNKISNEEEKFVGE